MHKRFLIIDGYNLLHTCGFIATPVGPGTLERARNLLVGILVKHLSAADRSRTTLVFDSNQTELAAHQSTHNLLIEFSVDHEDADAHIEQLIRKHSAPKQLTVVSSDHRLHKAARTRGALAIDSDRWLDQLSTVVRKTDTDASDTRMPTDQGKLPVDVAFWMNELQVDTHFIESLSDEAAASRSQQKPNNPPSKHAGSGGRPDPGESPSTEGNVNDVHDGQEWGDIFPPGYADDLLDTDESPDSDEVPDSDRPNR